MQANKVEEKQGGPSSVTLLDAKKGDVVKVVYTWPKGTSTVTSKGKEAARAVVVDVARDVDPPKKPEPKKDPKKDAPDAGPAEEAPPPVKETAKFPGGKTVASSLEAFEPLKSRRTLGEVDADRLKAMGLEKPERSLTVTTANGKTLTLEIGESSYGGQGRYARVKGEKVVHLLDPAVTSGFEGGADTLMEKRVVTANIEEIAGYTARFGDKDASFTQLDREQSAKRKWVAAGDKAQEANEAAGKLMSTLRNVRATKLADAKSAGSAVATFVIDVAGRDKQKIEILERTDGEGHLASVDGWLFEISDTQGKELLDDLAAVFP
jgi:hypothetical protein